MPAVAAMCLVLGVSGANAQMPKGAKEFTLTATEVPLTLASGKVVKAWAYNGQVPGPEIRVREGERVRITFKNELPVASSIHWHGVDVPWTMDGPPGINQKPVRPGETFVYEFVAKPRGTRFYHTHGSGERDEALQMDMGLYGPFIIEGKNETKHAREHTLILSERLSTLLPWEASSGTPLAAGGHGAGTPDVFFMNGKSWPEAQPLRVKKGDRVRLRLINAGSTSTHPMHLHGHSFRIVAIDGNTLPAPIVRDVVSVSPGERYDIEFVANNPGVWLFHCHELHHMDAGMAMLIQYEGYDAVDKAPSAKAAPPPAHGPGMRH
jgi:FtsP/CotA-like multicopper oxidase with cupredoxin domain